MNFNFPSTPYATLCKLKILFILLTSALAACGGSGSGGSNISSSDLTNSPIAGSWISPCDASSGALSFVDTIDYFANGTFKRTVFGYFDLACSDPGFDAVTTGNVQESNAFELPDRGLVRNLSLLTNAFIITPRSEAAVSFFNSQSSCGISDWEINVDYDISTCTNRPGDDTSRRPTPYTDYSIYLVERGQLFYGNELSFTAENRPTTLAPRPNYIRSTGAIGDEFPQILKGFWVLPESNQYVELTNQGLIRFYGLTNQGCYGFSFLTLFSEGGDRYLDPFRTFAYTISESNGNLLLSAGTDPQVFVYMPSDIPVEQLNLCI